MSANSKKRGAGLLAPNRITDYVDATVGAGQRQQRRNAVTWLERMQAAADRQRNKQT